MNREQIYIAFRKKAESDNKYFNFGKTGIIEETLAYFGLKANSFKGTSSWVHEENLEKLHEFMIKKATDEQIQLVYRTIEDEKYIKQDYCNDSSGKVFVSMPMNKDKYSCVDEIRNGMQKAITNTGNEAYFVDLDMHNRNISDKIIEEIRNCKFLVADFTCQNTGVYFEAGYAKGIGKTVIHTCKKNDFENIHFDIKQIQFVVWTDERDLEIKLKKQISKSGLGIIKI